jgi:hypothetical protein
MKKRNKIAISVLAAMLTYSVSYCTLRCTKFLVRREWIATHPHSKTHERTIYASDVGHGTYFNAEFKPKKDPLPVLYFPLWQAELRIRGKYFHHDDIVVIHVDLLESNNHIRHIDAGAPNADV